MAHGMFNSNSGGSGGHRSSSGVGVGLLVETSPGVAFTILAIFVAIALVSAYMEAKATAEEEHLDATTYVETSRENFDRWETTRQDHIVEGSLWFESGSSHRDEYHCKGGQFQVDGGATVTFCCNVEAGGNPPCLVVTP